VSAAKKWPAPSLGNRRTPPASFSPAGPINCATLASRSSFKSHQERRSLIPESPARENARWQEDDPSKADSEKLQGKWGWLPQKVHMNYPPPSS